MPISEVQQTLELARSINEETELMLLIITAVRAQRSTNWTQEELLSTIQEMAKKHVLKVRGSDKNDSENNRLLYLACILVALLRSRKIKSLDIDGMNTLNDFQWENEFFNITRTFSSYKKQRKG